MQIDWTERNWKLMLNFGLRMRKLVHKFGQNQTAEKLEHFEYLKREISSDQAKRKTFPSA